MKVDKNTADCEICMKTMRKDHLKRHMKKHENKNNKDKKRMLLNDMMEGIIDFKVLLEEESADAVKRERENIRRDIERKIRKLDDEATEYMQSGEGYSKLSEKIECAGRYSNKWVNLFLNDEEIEDICASVQLFLDGQMKFDDEIQRDIDVTMQDQDLRRNMDEIIKEKYPIEEKREFLLNSVGGVKMISFVYKYLLGDVIADFKTECEKKQRCCEKLKKKLKKIKGKDDESEESDGDEKEDEGGEEEESEGEEASEISESEEGEEGDSDGIDESDDSEEEGDGDEEDEDDREEGDGDEEDEDDGDSQYKNKIVLDCGRDRPLTWEY